MAVTEKTAPLLSQEEEKSQGLYSPQSIRDKGRETPKYLIDGMIRHNSINLVVGDSGVGKTPLMVSMGLSITSGKPWLGHKICTTGNVLYFDGESTANNFWEVLQTTSNHMGLEKVSENFITHGKNYSDVSRDIERVLIDGIERVQPKLIIIDPLRIFFPDLEREASFVAKLVGQLQKWNTSGYSVVFVHHMRKPDRKAELPNLAEDPDAWIKESAGTMALINHTDSRFGVENINHYTGIGIAGRVRGVGVVNYMELNRVYNEEGDPVGYEIGTLLKPSDQKVYDELPKEVRWKEIKGHFGGSEWKTKLFIEHCLTKGLFSKREFEGKTIYIKN